VLGSVLFNLSLFFLAKVQSWTAAVDRSSSTEGKPRSEEEWATVVKSETTRLSALKVAQLRADAITKLSEDAETLDAMPKNNLVKSLVALHVADLKKGEEDLKLKLREVITAAVTTSATKGSREEQLFDDYISVATRTATATTWWKATSLAAQLTLQLLEKLVENSPASVAQADIDINEVLKVFVSKGLAAKRSGISVDIGAASELPAP
jgi:hypothetical protein